jgi:hypothetical protein
MTKGLEFKSWQGQECSPLQVIQTSSEVHPTSYTVGNWRFFPREVKRPGRETDHSPPSAEVKKMWIYISTPPYIFMANFTFLPLPVSTFSLTLLKLTISTKQVVFLNLEFHCDKSTVLKHRSLHYLTQLESVCLCALSPVLINNFQTNWN